MHHPILNLLVLFGSVVYIFYAGIRIGRDQSADEAIRSCPAPWWRKHLEAAEEKAGIDAKDGKRAGMAIARFWPAAYRQRQRVG